MISNWFRLNILSNYNITLNFGAFSVRFAPYLVFGFLMFCLFLWATFHLFTDCIMAFRAVFGFGYKKRKGGSH